MPISTTGSSGLVVTTTADDQQLLIGIARQLLQRRWAGCCQIVGPITSLYHWNQQIEQASEWMCLIKTTAEQYPRVEQLILELHTYETPEIIATPIVRGSTGYLNWLNASLNVSEGDQEEAESP
jgi:periplasmic divalent cation tolerance protein